MFEIYMGIGELILNNHDIGETLNFRQVLKRKEGGVVVLMGTWGFLEMLLWVGMLESYSSPTTVTEIILSPTRCFISVLHTFVFYLTETSSDLSPQTKTRPLDTTHLEESFTAKPSGQRGGFRSLTTWASWLGFATFIQVSPYKPSRCRVDTVSALTRNRTQKHMHRRRSPVCTRSKLISLVTLYLLVGPLSQVHVNSICSHT